MMKTLRYFMLLAMTAMVSTTFAQKVTFDFDADANTLFGIEGSSSGSGQTYDASGEFNEDKTATVEGVSVTVSASETDAKTRNRIWKTSPRLRLYNGTVTVSAPGHKITGMVFTVNWNSDKKALNFNATADAGTHKETIPIETEGETVDIDFNSKYLVDALKVIEDDTVRIEFNGNQGPCIIVPVQGDSYVYLVLPIRR